MVRMPAAATRRRCLHDPMRSRARERSRRRHRGAIVRPGVVPGASDAAAGGQAAAGDRPSVVRAPQVVARDRPHVTTDRPQVTTGRTHVTTDRPGAGIDRGRGAAGRGDVVPCPPGAITERARCPPGRPSTIDRCLIVGGEPPAATPAPATPSREPRTPSREPAIATGEPATASPDYQPVTATLDSGPCGATLADALASIDPRMLMLRPTPLYLEIAARRIKSRGKLCRAVIRDSQVSTPVGENVGVRFTHRPALTPARKTWTCDVNPPRKCKLCRPDVHVCDEHVQSAAHAERAHR